MFSCLIEGPRSVWQKLGPSWIHARSKLIHAAIICFYPRRLRLRPPRLVDLLEEVASQSLCMESRIFGALPVRGRFRRPLATTPHGVAAAVENFGQCRVFPGRFRTALRFPGVCFRHDVTIDFGAFSCRGVPPEPSLRHHGRPLAIILPHAWPKGRFEEVSG